MRILILAACLLFSLCELAQAQSVGIGTTNPDASAQLDISNSSKGVLIPRMATTAINNIANPAKGLLVYDSLQNKLMVNMGSASSPNWQPVAGASGWSLTGNSGTVFGTDFLGTTDGTPLYFRVNNRQAGHLDTGGIYGANTSFGYLALQNGLSAASNNTASGYMALNAATKGSYNVADGSLSLSSNVIGGFNVAVGFSAMSSNTSGNFNTAVGESALVNNTDASGNTALGALTLAKNSTGSDNVAVGLQSLFNNNTGVQNTAIGAYALASNSTANNNTALGYLALNYNTTGTNNTGNGVLSLLSNTLGNDNTALGTYSLQSNTTGNYNTAVGFQALVNTTTAEYNTSIGYNAGASFDNGYNNVFLGANCDVNGGGYYNVIAIGQGVVCTAPSQARIGNAATNSIGGYADWTNFSDGRFKKNIQENVIGLDFIMKLRPVTYHLDVSGLNRQLTGKNKNMAALNQQGIAEKEQAVQTGFLAQDVEKAAEAAGFDFSGVDKPKNPGDFYGLRYSQFVVPLVKAVQEQQAEIDALKKQNELLISRLEALEAKR